MIPSKTRKIESTSAQNVLSKDVIVTVLSFLETAQKLHNIPLINKDFCAAVSSPLAWYHVNVSLLNGAGNGERLCQRFKLVHHLHFSGGSIPDFVTPETFPRVQKFSSESVTLLFWDRIIRFIPTLRRLLIDGKETNQSEEQDADVSVDAPNMETYRASLNWNPLILNAPQLKKAKIVDYADITPNSFANLVKLSVSVESVEDVQFLLKHVPESVTDLWVKLGPDVHPSHISNLLPNRESVRINTHAGLSELDSVLPYMTAVQSFVFQGKQATHCSAISIIRFVKALQKISPKVNDVHIVSRVSGCCIMQRVAITGLRWDVSLSCGKVMFEELQQCCRNWTDQKARETDIQMKFGMINSWNKRGGSCWSDTQFTLRT